MKYIWGGDPESQLSMGPNVLATPLQKYLPKGCPYILMCSALKIMQWLFPQFSCVDLKKKQMTDRKTYRYLNFGNQNRYRLHKT